MSETELVRVDLHEALEGHHILVDPEELTFGMLEDFQSQKAERIMDALTSAIKGGDLSKGTDRAGLRRLTTDRMAAVITGVGVLLNTPKRGS